MELAILYDCLTCSFIDLISRLDPLATLREAMMASSWEYNSLSNFTSRVTLPRRSGFTLLTKAWGWTRTSEG